MEKNEDTKSMCGEETGFVFGRHEDPADPDNELRRIAGSIAVNSDTREKVEKEESGSYFVVRDIDDKTLKCLQKTLPIVKCDSSDLKDFGRIMINRLAMGILRNDPNWNVLRPGDAALGVDKLRDLHFGAMETALDSLACDLKLHLVQMLRDGRSLELKFNEMPVSSDFFDSQTILKRMCGLDNRYSFETAEGKFVIKFKL